MNSLGFTLLPQGDGASYKNHFDFVGQIEQDTANTGGGTGYQDTAYAKKRGFCACVGVNASAQTTMLRFFMQDGVQCLAKTTDGAVTWNVVKNPFEPSYTGVVINDIAYDQFNYRFMVVGYSPYSNGGLFATSPDGITWTVLVTSFGSEALCITYATGVSGVVATTPIFVGCAGRIGSETSGYYSTNGGTSWTDRGVQLSNAMGVGRFDITRVASQKSGAVHVVSMIVENQTTRAPQLLNCTTGIFTVFAKKTAFATAWGTTERVLSMDCASASGITLVFVGTNGKMLVSIDAGNATFTTPASVTTIFGTGQISSVKFHVGSNRFIIAGETSVGGGYIAACASVSGNPSLAWTDQTATITTANPFVWCISDVMVSSTNEYLIGYSNAICRSTSGAGALVKTDLPWLLNVGYFKNRVAKSSCRNPTTGDIFVIANHAVYKNNLNVPALQNPVVHATAIGAYLGSTSLVGLPAGVTASLGTLLGNGGYVTGIASNGNYTVIIAYSSIAGKVTSLWNNGGAWTESSGLSGLCAAGSTPVDIIWSQEHSKFYALTSEGVFYSPIGHGWFPKVVTFAGGTAIEEKGSAIIAIGSGICKRCADTTGVTWTDASASFSGALSGAPTSASSANGIFLVETNNSSAYSADGLTWYANNYGIYSGNRSYSKLAPVQYGGFVSSSVAPTLFVVGLDLIRNADAIMSSSDVMPKIDAYSNVVSIIGNKVEDRKLVLVTKKGLFASEFGFW